MYNDTRKQEYLRTTSVSVSYILNNLFTQSEFYEERNGKDICDFIEEEIMELLAGFSSSSTNTLSSYASLLRGYTQWCCDNNINIDHINHFDMIGLDVISQCINKIAHNNKYITLEELHEVMDNIVNVGDKALVLSLFYGICGESCIELTNITENDISLSDNTVSLITERTIHVPLELINLLNTSCNTYDYILTSGKRFDSLALDTSDLSPFKKRANARFNTQEKARLRIVSRLVKLREDTGCIALTIDRLKNSGMIHFINQAIDNGVNKEMIFNSKEMKDIQKYYNCEHVQPFTLKAKFKDFI